MPPTVLPRGALPALLEKYARLVKLRAERDANPLASPSAQKDTLQALAQSYPGCLRELDRLPLASLQQRHAEVATALAEGTPKPWMLWIWGYHQLLAAALDHKARRPRPRSLAWPLVSEPFLRSAEKPAGGRISALVLTELARQVEQPPETLAAALFPKRRPT